MRVMRDRELRRVTNLMELQLVEVAWHDATSNHGWYTLDEIRKDKTLITECRTVGYLVRRDRRHVVVAQTRIQTGKLSELWGIPTPWVARVTVIRPGQRARTGGRGRPRP